MEKNTHVPLYKVNQRIVHWERKIEIANKRNPENTRTIDLNKIKQIKETNEKLLSYWICYKNLHYPNN
jgi:hypothetical protein